MMVRFGGALKWNHIASTLFFDINPPRSLQMVLEGRAVRDAGSLSLLISFHGGGAGGSHQLVRV